MFRVDRINCKGGGVILYIKCDLQASVSHELTDLGFAESVWCSLKLTTGQLLLGLCYRSPSSTSDNNNMLLRLMEQAVSVRGITHVMIMGDFNCPAIDYTGGFVQSGGDSFDTEFYDKTSDLFLVQNVFDDTRIRSGYAPSKLDYVFTDEEYLIESVNYDAPLGKSDHVVLTWNLVAEPEERLHSLDNKYNYWKGDYTSMMNDLHAINWEQEFHNCDVNNMWLVFREKLHTAVKKHVPLSRSGRRQKKNTWLRKGTLKKIKLRNASWKKYRSIQTATNFEAYRCLRNEVNKLVGRDHEAHCKKVVGSFKHCPKKFYGYIRNMRTANISVNKLLKTDSAELTSTDEEAAEVLSKFFKRVFTIEKDGPVELPVSDMLSVRIPVTPVTFDIDTVMKKLSKLKSDKSPGPDGLHPMILNRCADAIAEPLTWIFQKSFDTGTVPSDWRTANISPIFKKGSRRDPGNYRPVSLTSVVCKVMESIIRDDMVILLEEEGLFNPSQHGFMKKRSCLTNLLECFEEWTKVLDDGFGINVIYLDYRKAFDSVPHKRLITKLQSYGFHSKTIAWIEYFLKDRWMRVRVRGSYSGWFEMISGVPQGSVLGPILFLLYVNDLPSWIQNSMKMFADDTKVWQKIVEDSDSSFLQADLKSLEEWSERWQLKFNPAKCKVIHIGHKLRTSYKMSDNGVDKVLEDVSEEKDLGVFVTSDLKPSTQCMQQTKHSRF